MDRGEIKREDLVHFRMLLLNDIRELLKVKESPVQTQWMRSAEVRKLLKISAGTLQNLRISGKLKPSKINGTYFYCSKELSKLLDIPGQNKGGEL